MRRFVVILSRCIAILLFLSLPYAIYRLCVGTIHFFEQANPSVAAALIALVATVVGGIVVASLTQIYNQRREREDAHRGKKIEIYSGYVELLRRVQAEGNEHLQYLRFGEGEMLAKLSEIKRDMILWASPEVIKAQLHFEITASDGTKVLRGVDNLLRALRKDVGLSNQGLNSMELMKMQIKMMTGVSSNKLS